VPNLDQNFTINTEQNLETVAYRFLGHNNLYRTTTLELLDYTGPYSHTMCLPKVPVIHPYGPNAEHGQYRHSQGVLRVLASIGLNSATLSDEMKAAMAALNVTETRTCIVLQTNPWKNVELLYRPHPFLHSEAPMYDPNYSMHSQNISLAFSDGIQPFILNKVDDIGIVTHQGEDGQVYSPNNMPWPPMRTLPNTSFCDSTHTQTFYSLCVDAANPQRGGTCTAVLTLHVLLNDDNTRKVDTICNAMRLEADNGRNISVAKFWGELNKANTEINMTQMFAFCCGVPPALVGARPIADAADLGRQFSAVLAKFNRPVLPVARPAPMLAAYAAAAAPQVAAQQAAEIKEEFSFVDELGVRHTYYM
jgi:hypothetical protein